MFDGAGVGSVDSCGSSGVLPFGVLFTPFGDLVVPFDVLPIPFVDFKVRMRGPGFVGVPGVVPGVAIGEATDAVAEGATTGADVGTVDKPIFYRALEQNEGLRDCHHRIIQKET